MAAKYLYRIRLIATDAAADRTAKSRVKNLGNISQMDTDNRRDAMHETRRLREMIEHESWQVPAQIIAERSEVSDFLPVDIDTLEPAREDAGASDAPVGTGETA